MFTGCLKTKSGIYYILEQSKETVLEFYKRTEKVFWIYQWLNTINVKLSDSLLNKLKAAVENRTVVTLRMSLKMFDGDELPHELLLTKR